MTLSVYSDDLNAFFATDEPGVLIATYAGSSFGVKWFFEDLTPDENGIVNATTYFLAKASDVVGIGSGVLVQVGSNAATGDGFVNDGDMFVDMGDTWDMSDITVYYVTEVRNFGDVGLVKQIILSKDKP